MELTKRYNSAAFFLLLSLPTLPIYLWSSGAPQLSHLSAFIAAIFICSEFTKNNLFKEDFFKLMLILVVYSAIINITFSGLYFKIRPLIYPFFYLYCLIFCLTIMTLIKRDSKFILLLYYSIILSLFSVTVLSFIFLPEVGARHTVLFNNPNQLGYYSILSTLILSLINSRTKTNKYIFYIGIILGLYLGFLSLSKAVIYGNFIFVSLYILAALIKRQFIHIPSFIFIAAFSYLLANFTYSYIKYESTASDPQQQTSLLAHYFSETFQGGGAIAGRTDSTGSDDDLGERGYTRIVDHPSYLVFGAAEGINERFTPSKELHSTFGTLFFSYGIVGLGIILWLIWLILRKTGWEAVIYFVPLSIYSLTHNGLRSPLLWLFVMLVLLDKNLYTSDDKEAH